MVRFCYEAFFELILCALINASNIASGSLVWWIISVATIALGALSIIFLFSLFFHRGPYLKGTYAPKTLIHSFWGKRYLSEDVLLRSLAITNTKGDIA